MRLHLCRRDLKIEHQRVSGHGSGRLTALEDGIQLMYSFTGKRLVYQPLYTVFGNRRSC